jgi:heptosyltransferase-2
LAAVIKAKKKFGFHMNPQGHMAPINKASEYCFDLGLSDDLKFNMNEKSYQEVTYECSELNVPRPMDSYDFTLKESDREAAQFLMKRLRWDTKNTEYVRAPKGLARAPIIGLNTGAGRVFRTKQWLEEYFLELAKELKKKYKARVLLLGGEDEDVRNKRLATKLKTAAHYPGCGFSIRQFAGLLEQCDLVVTGDTLAMHLALAVKTPTVVLFGSTCEQEVDLYGMGRKLVSKPSCAPCYKNECDQPEWMKCMKDITPLKVYRAVTDVLEQRESNPPHRPA